VGCGLRAGLSPQGQEKYRTRDAKSGGLSVFRGERRPRLVRVVSLAERRKPKLRGVAHEFGFYAALGLGAPLILTAEPGRARVAALIFSACVAACFGASALYHRLTWTPRVRAWLARLDHAGIYLLIAGTYYPVGLILMSAQWAVPVLSVVSGGAVAAILIKAVWVRAPKWLSAAAGIALGWSGVVAFSELLAMPAGGLLLLVAGGVLYTAGAIVYVRRSPDPLPHAFGYHELFHLFTLAAAGCHYAAVAFFVLPRA
jgi:hemolysin III